MKFQKLKSNIRILVIYFSLVFIFYWLEVTALSYLAREGFLGDHFTSGYMSEEWLMSGPSASAFIARMKRQLLP